MNRKATAGELSASIAHEVNQTLTGMWGVNDARFLSLQSSMADDQC
jgi:C4-dicarboxylate-specific signal transduction histidine kinase